MEDSKTECNLLYEYFVNNTDRTAYVKFEHSYSVLPTEESITAQPTRFLFAEPSNAHEIISDDDIIDVVSIPGEEPIFYDPELERDALFESEKYVTTALRNTFDWTERIDRTGWNNVQNQLFDKTMSLFDGEHLSRLVHQGRADEVVKRRLTINKAARQFRRILCHVSYEPTVLKWLHEQINNYFPREYVAIYIDLLQRLSALVPPGLLEQLNPPTLCKNPLQNASKVREFIRSEPRDPYHRSLARTIPERLSGAPLLLFLPVGNGLQPMKSNSRVKHLFDEFALLAETETFVLTNGTSSSALTIPTLLDKLIMKTRCKISEMKTQYPNRPIVLIGIDSSALLACRVSLMEEIAALVCLGFPCLTAEGKLNKADNRILDTKTPILFVVGQHSVTSSVSEVEDIRMKLECKSGLIVIEGADDYLRLSHQIKISNRITQKVADRCILNEVAKFLEKLLPKAAKYTNEPSIYRPADALNTDDDDLKNEQRKKSKGKVDATKKCWRKRSVPMEFVEYEQILNSSNDNQARKPDLNERDISSLNRRCLKPMNQQKARFTFNRVITDKETELALKSIQDTIESPNYTSSSLQISDDLSQLLNEFEASDSQAQSTSRCVPTSFSRGKY